MKVGDLICYNACGMKHKTLGLVLDLERKRYYGNTGTCLLIQWCVAGDYMPRRSSFDYGVKSYGDPIYAGEIVWHDIGDWFEVVK